MESSNTTTIRTRRRIQPTCIYLLAFTTITTTTLFVWKSSRNHDPHGRPLRGLQYNEQISSDDNNGSRHGRLSSSPDNVETNNTLKVFTDINVRSSSSGAVVIVEENQHHDDKHNHQDTNVTTASPYYHEEDNNANDFYNDIHNQRQAAREIDTFPSPLHYEGEEYQEEAFMIDDAAYDYDEYYYYDEEDQFPSVPFGDVDGRDDDEDEYYEYGDDYYYLNDNHEESDFNKEEEWEYYGDDDKHEYNNQYKDEFLKAMMMPQEEGEDNAQSEGRHLRYRRRYFYGGGSRQNFCLSRGCVGHNQCYNINCNAGCFGGRCQAGSRYNHRNYYRYRNRYYYRRRRRRRYYYSNRIVCANNLGCTGTALPYCIRGFCQATNYGQFCVANPGCANGIYNQCINGACTGRLLGGPYYDYNRIVDCVSTERELRLRLEGNVVGNNIVVNICSPSTIFVSTVITSSINNLELNCVISGTGGVLGNNCKFISQGSRTNFLRLLGSNIIIRGITFENGFSSTNGGAIDILGSGQHRLIDCTFNGNRAVQRGGAVHIPQTSNVILINNEFNGNQALQCIDVFVQGSCRNS